MRYVLFLLMLTAAAAPCAGAQPEGRMPNGVAQTAYADLVKLFAYEPGEPLDMQETGREEVPGLGAEVRHVTFASPVAGRATASIVTPLEPARHRARGNEPPYAGIIFMHWGQGNRTEFLWEAVLYARAGAVSIVVDAPWARPEPWKQPGEGYMTEPELPRKMYVQTVIDLRRAVDVLLARGDIDPARIAYVGHSFGATWGGALAGIEKRIKTYVLMAGLPAITNFERTGLPSFDEYADQIRTYLKPEQLDNYVHTISPINPENFVGHAAPSSVFMQFALFDSWISKRAAERYFDAASEPKEIRWYPTSHELNDVAALVDRALWLGKEIGIDSVAPTLRRIVKEGSWAR